MPTTRRVQPRQPKLAMYESNPYCKPLREMYSRLVAGAATTWNQVEADFLRTMSDFDSGIPSVAADFDALGGTTFLSAALQNGKGDWFNDIAAELLRKCSGIEAFYARRGVPGLVVASHNLDGVYPGDPNREIDFLLEAKMMGSPKHVNSPNEDAKGRRGSADLGKRVKELAFKSIDLKAEAARRLAMIGQAPGGGGAGGGDLSTWLHANRPRIYFLMAIRVVSDTDFRASLRWAETAAQVVDAVGLYCYEPDGTSLTRYRRRVGVPPAYELERVLWRACLDLQKLRTEPPSPIPTDVPPSPAVDAESAERSETL